MNNANINAYSGTRSDDDQISVHSISNRQTNKQTNHTTTLRIESNLPSKQENAFSAQRNHTLSHATLSSWPKTAGLMGTTAAHHANRRNQKKTYCTDCAACAPRDPSAALNEGSTLRHPWPPRASCQQAQDHYSPAACVSHLTPE